MGLAPGSLSAAATALADFAGQTPHETLHFFFHLGLIGLFFVSAVDSSFVPLPVPGITDIMIVIFAAGRENPFLLVLIATAGSAVGGFVSHAAGRAGGITFLEKHVSQRLLKQVTTWMESHAILAVSLPALLPPPMPLSPFVLAAGATRMSRRKFMTAFTLSRLARHAIAAWLGVRYGRSVLGLWKRFSAHWGRPFLIALWSLILVFTAVAIWKLWKTSRSVERAQSRAA